MSGWRKRFSIFIAVVAILLWTASTGIAQTVLGTVIGTVTDTSGAVLPGVTITITNLQTNISTTTLTNESGDYNVPQLVPGKYRVSAELPGFKKKTQTGITLPVQQKIRIDLKLEVGDLSENVTVMADAPIAQSHERKTVSGSCNNKLGTPDASWVSYSIHVVNKRYVSC